ncbi:MAG: DUF4432 family protein [Algisphaera sp.]
MTQLSRDAEKFSMIQQIGGIRTARYDWPDAGGSPGCRVAIFETGTPLRFVLNLDRGGDIVEASYGGTSLAWLSPNGYAPPTHASSQKQRWLHGWNGGLLSTCGPDLLGAEKDDDDNIVDLHGMFHHQPAAIQAIHQPDPRNGVLDMSIELVVRATHIFTPIYEIKRTISATLGIAGVRVRDEVRNISAVQANHHWLYHVNFGYPLVNTGTQLFYTGDHGVAWGVSDAAKAVAEPAWKTVPEPLAEHNGWGERGVIVVPPADDQGWATAGLLNPSLGLGVALHYDTATLPRLANWQHYGHAGTYVTALEPFVGQLLPSELDATAMPAVLEPQESRAYAIDLNVLTDESQHAALKKQDGPIALA